MADDDDFWLEPDPISDYNCCCNNIHSKRGVKAIAFTGMFYPAFKIFIIFCMQFGFTKASVDVGTLLIEITMSVFLLKGYYEDSKFWIKWFIIWMLICWIYYVFAIPFLAVCMFTPNSAYTTFINEYMIGQTYKIYHDVIMTMCDNGRRMSPDATSFPEVTATMLTYVWVICSYFLSFLIDLHWWAVVRSYDKYLADENRPLCEQIDRLPNNVVAPEKNDQNPA